MIADYLLELPLMKVLKERLAVEVWGEDFKKSFGEP
jgi:hypothetical protein